MRVGGSARTRAAHVAKSLAGRIPLVIDDGATEAGLELTIVRGGEVLRPGPLNYDELFRGEGRGPVAKQPDAGARPSPGNIVAPGQLESHYAPGKPLRLNATRAHDEYLIGFGTTGGDETLSATANLTEAAANLFDALHRADASAAKSIAIAPIPNAGIGVAINDRLRRAAHRD